MKKTTLYWALALCVLFLVSCWKSPDINWQEKWILKDSSDSSIWEDVQVKDETTQTEQKTWNTEEKFSATMNEIFKKWKTSTCNFTMDMDWNKTEWVFYVEKDKMRFETKATVDWQNMVTTAIVKDGYSYSWSNMQQWKWYKMKEVKEWEENSESEMWPGEREQKMDFECKDWVPSWIFELPSDIEFEEFIIPKIPDISGMWEY